MITKRDKSLDVLRGIAIFIMIFANAAPFIVAEPHPFWIRSIDSYAAPIFIALAGFGISFATREQIKSNFKPKILIRGVLIILVAVLIDIFTWNISPFVGYDVLYVIGFSVVLSSFFDKISSLILLISAILILLLAVFFQVYLAYPEQISDIPLTAFSFSTFSQHFDSFIFAGWFPIFPWLAIFILGYLGGRAKARFGRLKYIFTLIFLLVYSSSLFYIYHQDKTIRDGFSELFYPADFAFSLHMIALLLLIWINFSFFKSKVFYLFSVLGRNSLFIYMFHTFIISKLIVLIYELTEESSLSTYFIFYCAIYAVSFLLLYIKKTSKWKKAPYIFRFIFGS
jgi:uncharacterized membrane protein